MEHQDLQKSYYQNGFISGIKILETEEALKHRQQLEHFETQYGELHYKTKIHTLMRSPYELATHSRVLDVVELLIGKNILLHNVTYIIKEPRTLAHVSWHQDLTYWGFSNDKQVSMWLALSPATELSGCMKMIPGSHIKGQKSHTITDDESNVLYSGQTVADVDESMETFCPLNPGEASFHHGWTLHSSMPNQSDDRRIGLNVQYLATDVIQTKNDSDSAILVRGEDRFGHYKEDVPAEFDFAPEAVHRQAELQNRYINTAKAKS